MGNEIPAASHRMFTRAGDTFTRIITWTEDDGTPIDLTSASVEWSLVGGGIQQQYVDSPEASITNAAGGEVSLVLTPTQTRSLAGGTHAYELTVTMVDATRITLLFGSLSVEREVLP